MHIHVAGGGGSAAPLLHLLQASGFQVTCGVVAENDSHYAAAQGLGIPVLSCPPFSAVPKEQHQEHRQWMQRADLVVVPDLPIGTGNLCNLQAAEAAREVLLVEDRLMSERDYTNGQATELFDLLKSRAAVVCSKGFPVG